MQSAVEVEINGGYWDRYGQADRRRQLESVLEASGRTLLERGTILVVDVQDPCPGEAEVDPVSAVYRGTRLGYDSCGTAYYVPADALKGYGDPTEEPWFYPASLTPLQASDNYACLYTSETADMVVTG